MKIVHRKMVETVTKTFSIFLLKFCPQKRRTIFLLNFSGNNKKKELENLEQKIWQKESFYLQKKNKKKKNEDKFHLKHYFTFSYSFTFIFNSNPSIIVGIHFRNIFDKHIL